MTRNARRPADGREDDRASLKRSTRRERRVTLTAAPRALAPIDKGLARLRQGPRDMTGNVQLYLPECVLPRIRMGGPLVGFGGRVKDRWGLSR